MEKVFIIIVTYNGSNWIRECLDSCKDYQIIVIDNNSTDDTKIIINKEYPKAFLVTEKKNHGFGGANNIGIKYALDNGADYVFLLNQDAYLIDNCIENSIKIHQSNFQYGILSPIHINGLQNKLDKSFSKFISYNNNANLYIDALKNNLKEVYEVPFVNAAGWLLPKATLEKIGGFDPLFFHYGEDDNYCQRVLYHGYKIGVVPSTFMIHDREFENKRLNDTIEKKIRNEEIKLKSELANINNDFDHNYKKKLRIYIHSFIKSFFKLKNTKYTLKKLCLLINMKDSILISRKQNINKGMNYLNKNKY